MFLDEAHTIRDEESEDYHAVAVILAEFRFLLSDSIFLTRWKDIFALASLLKGHLFDDRAAFYKAFAKKEGDGSDTVPGKVKGR